MKTKSAFQIRAQLLRIVADSGRDNRKTMRYAIANKAALRYNSNIMRYFGLIGDTQTTWNMPARDSQMHQQFPREIYAK